MAGLPNKTMPTYELFRDIGLNETLQERISVWCLAHGIDPKIFIRVAMAHFFFILIEKPGDECKLYLEYLQSFSMSMDRKELRGL